MCNFTVSPGKTTILSGNIGIVSCLIAIIDLPYITLRRKNRAKGLAGKSQGRLKEGFCKYNYI
jgi:hypothetical protein